MVSLPTSNRQAPCRYLPRPAWSTRSLQTTKNEHSASYPARSQAESSVALFFCSSNTIQTLLF